MTKARLPLQPEVGAGEGKGSGGKGDVQMAGSSRGGTRDAVGMGAGGGGLGGGREEGREGGTRGEEEGKGKLLRPQGVSMEEAGSDAYQEQRWAQKHKGFLAGRSAAGYGSGVRGLGLGIRG